MARASAAFALLLASTLLMLAVAMGFLVAAALLRRSNSRKRDRWAALERDWGQALDELAAGGLDAGVLHASLARRDRLVFLDFLYKAGVGAGGERRQLIRGLAEPYLGDLERRVVDGDVWQRARALRTLADLCGPAAGAAVEAALDDPAPHVALTAARAYARLRLGPVEGLLARVARYHDWDPRLLRHTLTSFGGSACEALHERFAAAGAPVWVRCACAGALAELGYGGANETALELLSTEAETDLQAAALRVLRAPLTPVQLQRVKVLCSVNDPVIRAQAVACLVRAGEARDAEELQRALGDRSPWVVLSASRAAARPAMPAPAVEGV